MTATTDVNAQGRGITESEPTPTPHTAGWGGPETGPETGPTRAGAHAREDDSLTAPGAPSILRTLFVRDDAESPESVSLWRTITPRFWDRVDYALAGDWCAQDARTVRWLYLLLYTMPVAIPLALALDLIDWAVHPLGRFLVTALLVTLLFVIL